MNKALFLDRDGILIKERGDYNYLDKHFKINHKITPLLQFALKNQFLLIVITNQGGVEKGLYAHKEIEIMHEKISNYFLPLGIMFTDFFHCEHHDSLSSCICRKPSSLMIEKACAVYNINPKASYMIGDKETDKKVGERVGAKGIQIRANTTVNNYHKIIL